MKNPSKTGQKKVLASSVIAATFAVCDASVADETARHPVNCATAEGDLRAIAAERKHAEDQQVESAIAITPAGALLGLVTGTEKKRLTMLSGDYVKQLDQRADEIKATCNTQ